MYTPLIISHVTVEINTLLLNTKLNVLVDILTNVNIRNKIKLYFNWSFNFILVLVAYVNQLIKSARIKQVPPHNLHIIPKNSL